LVFIFCLSEEAIKKTEKAIYAAMKAVAG